MAGIAEGRLREERRSWRKDHPIGFVARPRSKADGSTDLLNWDVRMRRFNSRRRVASMAWRRVLSHPHAIAATPPRAGRHPGQEGHDVGRLRVQPHDGIHQRLPRQRAGRQVRVAVSAQSRKYVVASTPSTRCYTVSTPSTRSRESLRASRMNGGGFATVSNAGRARSSGT